MAKVKSFKDNELYIDDIRLFLSAIPLEVLKGKSIMITGASGLIGTFIVDALMWANSNYGFNLKIYAIGRSKERASDRFDSYYQHPLFDFIEQDICQPLATNIKVDYVIHGASNAHPKAYASDPVGTILTNVSGTTNILDFATKVGAIVIFMSSFEVYGSNELNKGERMTETYCGKIDMDKVRSCYPESKRMCEVLCRSYQKQYGTNVKIARLCRVFGPTQIKTDNKATAQFFNSGIKGENITLMSSGEQKNSYLYMVDVATALFSILLKGEVGVSYNVSSTLCEIKLNEFAEIVARKCGVNIVCSSISVCDTPNDSLVDNSKLLSIGWTPLYTIKDAIERTLSILKNKV